MRSSKIKIVFIFVSYLMCSEVYSQEYPSFIPAQIISYLKINYPDWKIIGNLWVLNEPALEEAKLDTTKCKPNIVWGDFNDDSKIDYSLFLEKSKSENQRSQLLVAFITNEDGYKFFVIEEENYPAYIAEFIWLSNKGTNYYDFETEEYFISDRDGIECITIEKSSRVYFFKNNVFYSITVSD